MAFESKRDKGGRINVPSHWLELVPLELMTKIGGLAGLEATSKFCVSNRKLFGDISAPMLCAAFVSDHWHTFAKQQSDQLSEMVGRGMSGDLRAAVASEVRRDSQNCALMKARTPLTDWMDSEIEAGRICDIERVAMSYDSWSIEIVTSVLATLGVLETKEDETHSARFLKVVWDHATKDAAMYQRNDTPLDEEALVSLLKAKVGKRLYVRLNTTSTDLKPWFSDEGGSSDDVALFVVSFDDELASTSLDVFRTSGATDGAIEPPNNVNVVVDLVSSEFISEVGVLSDIRSMFKPFNGLQLTISNSGGNVKSIGGNFLRNFTGLASLDLSGFGSVTSVGACFLYGCSSLTSLDLTGFSSVTSVEYFFLRGCSSLTSLDLSGFRSATSVGGYFLFGCSSLSSVDFTGFGAYDIEISESWFMKGCNQVAHVVGASPWILEHMPATR